MENSIYQVLFQFLFKDMAICLLTKQKSRKMKVKVTQLYLTLCNPVDYRVHGLLQARILEWIAFPSSRGSSQPRHWTQVSRIAGGFFTSWATREAPEPLKKPSNINFWSVSFAALFAELNGFAFDPRPHSHLFCVSLPSQLDCRGWAPRGHST